MTRTTIDWPCSHLDPESAPAAESALFDGMTVREVRSILDRFDLQTYRPGTRIVTEGKDGEEFFIIVDGEAELSIHDQPVASLGSGDFFGEIGVLDTGPRLGSVAATSTLVALTLANNRLGDVVVDHPKLGLNLLRGIIKRYRAGVTPARLAAAGSA